MKVQTTKQKALNYLCHHGIEGQKWGVKHGPPYPLDDSVSTGNSLKKRSHKEIRKSIKAKRKTGEPLDDEERLYRNTTRATMLGGPIAGLIAGGITSHKIKKENEAAQKKVDDENYNRKTVWDAKSKRYLVPNFWEGGDAVVKVSKTLDKKCRDAVLKKAKVYEIPETLLEKMVLSNGRSDTNGDKEEMILTYYFEKVPGDFDVYIDKNQKTKATAIKSVSFND